MLVVREHGRQIDDGGDGRRQGGRGRGRVEDGVRRVRARVGDGRAALDVAVVGGRVDAIVGEEGRGEVVPRARCPGLSGRLWPGWVEVLRGRVGDDRGVGVGEVLLGGVVGGRGVEATLGERALRHGGLMESGLCAPRTLCRWMSGSKKRRRRENRLI